MQCLKQPFCLAQTGWPELPVLETDGCGAGKAAGLVRGGGGVHLRFLVMP